MANSETLWIQTFTGKHFFPLDPRAGDVDIQDIAHALGQLCRFNGHCRCFYSVGQHSILVSSLVAPEHRLAALLHDAAEAYLSDISRPIKHQLRVKAIEYKILAVILSRFGVLDYPHTEIKRADNVMLATEARDLMGNLEGWYLPEPPMGLRIIPLSPEASTAAFLAAYEEYREEGGTRE